MALPSQTVLHEAFSFLNSCQVNSIVSDLGSPQALTSRPADNLTKLFGVRTTDLPPPIFYQLENIIGIMSLPGPLPEYFIRDSIVMSIHNLSRIGVDVFECLVSDERFVKERDLSPLTAARGLMRYFADRHVYGNAYNDLTFIIEQMGDSFKIGVFLKLLTTIPVESMAMAIEFAKMNMDIIRIETVGDIFDLFMMNQTTRQTIHVLDTASDMIRFYGWEGAAMQHISRQKRSIEILIRIFTDVRRELPHLIRKKNCMNKFYESWNKLNAFERHLGFPDYLLE